MLFGVPLLAAVWGMAKRKPFGRWLGIGLLSAMLIFSYVYPWLRPPPNPIDYGYAILLIRILMTGLTVFLILHLTFAGKVSAFFSQTIESTDALPQPPPSFNE